jgi:hypothetical protein
MAMTTTTMTMPHPTTDHVVGQWMNRRQDMILPRPLIATMATSHLVPFVRLGLTQGYQLWPAKL